jgi:hypothetical protein
MRPEPYMLLICQLTSKLQLNLQNQTISSRSAALRANGTQNLQGMAAMANPCACDANRLKHPTAPDRHVSGQPHTQTCPTAAVTQSGPAAK